MALSGRLLRLLEFVLLQHWLDGRRLRKAANADARRLIFLARDIALKACQHIELIGQVRTNPEQTYTAAGIRADWHRQQWTFDVIMSLPTHLLPSIESARQVIEILNQMAVVLEDLPSDVMAAGIAALMPWDVNIVQCGRRSSSLLKILTSEADKFK
jgi:hypothetical protein